MRLINAKTMLLEQFYGDKIPTYAILSHTWGNDEVTFQQFQGGEYEHLEGYKKLRYTCDQALEDSINYCWVDTCCIDKTSSSELSEAINHMFNWYARSELCYAYLVDVPPLKTQTAKGDVDVNGSASRATHFNHSRWWSRGGTLQELVAPKRIHFYDSAWRPIGDRDSNLVSRIQAISGIHPEIMGHPDRLHSVPIATRMSWAAKRSTTRKEDEAYCLLGLFSVNMPLLYGEEERSFIRLQEDIIRRSTDQSIFAWRSPIEDEELDTRLLATSPRCFDFPGQMTLHSSLYPSAQYEIGNAGLQINLPILRFFPRWWNSEATRAMFGGSYTPMGSHNQYAVLNCEHNGQLVGFALRQVGATQEGVTIFGIARADRRDCEDPARFSSTQDLEDSSKLHRLVHISEELAATAVYQKVIIQDLARTSNGGVAEIAQVLIRYHRTLRYCPARPSPFKHLQAAEFEWPSFYDWRELLYDLPDPKGKTIEVDVKFTLRERDDGALWIRLQIAPDRSLKAVALHRGREVRTLVGSYDVWNYHTAEDADEDGEAGLQQDRGMVGSVSMTPLRRIGLIWDRERVGDRYLDVLRLDEMRSALARAAHRMRHSLLHDSWKLAVGHLSS